MFRNKNDQLRAGWIILLSTIVLLIAQTVLSLPGFFLLQKVSPEASTQQLVNRMQDYPWVELLTNGLPVYGGILVILLLWKVLNKESLSTIGILLKKKVWIDFVVGTLFGVVAITIIFLILYASGNIKMVRGFLDPAFSTYTITYLLLFIGVGVLEELYFRGYMMKTLVSRGHKKWVIYTVPALLFAVFHGLNPNVTLLGLVNIGLVGLLFAYMFVVTENLWMPIGYHFSWNYVQGNVYGFPVSGTDPHGLLLIAVEEENEWLTGGLFGPEAGILATGVTLLFFIVIRFYSKKRIDK